MTEGVRKHRWKKGFGGGPCTREGCVARSGHVPLGDTCPRTEYWDPQRTTSVRDVFNADIYLTNPGPIKFEGLLSEDFPWVQLRTKRPDIESHHWARLLNSANEGYSEAKAKWDAQNIPVGTSEEVEAANYDTHPEFMNFLHRAVAEHSTGEPSRHLRPLVFQERSRMWVGQWNGHEVRVCDEMVKTIRAGEAAEAILAGPSQKMPGTWVATTTAEGFMCFDDVRVWYRFEDFDEYVKTQ